MAALSDDCFEAGGEMMPLDEALALLEKNVGPVTGMETVSLKEALGRVLAADVVAARDVPPHDNSAMDGYAVFSADIGADGETRLAVTGRVAAGHPLDRPAKPGEAIRIFTGAVMPQGPAGSATNQGPDTVVMQEDCRTEGSDVIIPPGVRPGANRRRRGEDVKAGTKVIEAGRLLRPQEIGLAASVGLSGLAVRARLRVAVFSTGDEVRDPADDAPQGCIFDANRFSVIGLLSDMGCAVTDLGILPDDLDAITKALAAAAPVHDLLITSGGVSLGDEDHVKAAVEALGSLHFWRLAIKPGRPIALGRIAAAAFVGLPGNPVAAMITFMLIARPLIFLLAGRTGLEPARFRVRAGFEHPKKTGRREWLRGRLVTDGDGGPVAEKFAAGGSGILTSMAWADGLIELAEDRGHVKEGEMVDFLPFDGIG